VVVNNPIPGGVAVSSWTGTNGTSGTNTAIADNIALLPVGSEVVYTFTVAIPPTQTGSVVSTVTVTSATPDPNSACMACVDTDIAPDNQADVQITISDGVNNYVAGTIRVYTVTVTNNGPSAAENVAVLGNLSSGINLANVSWTGSNGTSGTGNLNAIIANLPNGSTVVYTVTVPVPSNYNQMLTLIHSVDVTTTTIDPNPTCTTCTDVNVPTPFADIVTFKTNNQTQFLLDENVVYTITVRNDGPSDAVNVVVNDPLPVGTNITQMSWASSTRTV
jgi:uncharacterized repeat protein (TIGR01451 family)